MESIFDEKVNMKLSFNECLQKLCFSKENNIYIDCKYFKYLMKSKISLDFITLRLEEVFKQVLHKYNKYFVHISLKNISITDCDKYKSYAKDVSYKLYYLCENDPDNALEQLCIYNPSAVFSMLHKLFEMLCHVDVKKKIKMM
jgi:hypothetical protein